MVHIAFSVIDKVFIRGFVAAYKVSVKFGSIAKLISMCIDIFNPLIWNYIDLQYVKIFTR